MRNKVILIGGLLLILAILLFSKGYKEGLLGEASATNPMSQYDTIAELQKSVDFEFKVPSKLANTKGLYLYNYMGSMVEIKSEEFVFRAAPHIGEGADVSGDYNEYPIDRLYTGEGVELRYRGAEDSTLVNLNTSDIDYSIKFNSKIEEEEAFKTLDLSVDITRWEKEEKIEAKLDSSEQGEGKTKYGETAGNNESGYFGEGEGKAKYGETAGNKKSGYFGEGEEKPKYTVDGNKEDSAYYGEGEGKAEYGVTKDKQQKKEKDTDEITEDKDVVFYPFQDDKMGISFLLPKTKNEASGICANNQLAVTINKKVIFVIEKYDDGYDLSEFSGQSIIAVDDVYLIKYSDESVFDKESDEYRDYCTIIENIDIVADTLKES